MHPAAYYSRDYSRNYSRPGWLEDLRADESSIRDFTAWPFVRRETANVTESTCVGSQLNRSLDEGVEIRGEANRLLPARGVSDAGVDE